MLFPTLVTLLASPATAAFPFVVNEASDMAVSVLVEHRSTDVPPQEASAAAGKIVGDLLSEPPMTSLVNEAVESMELSGGKLNNQDANKLAAQFNTAFTSFSNGPHYASYTSMFKQSISDFDLKGLVSAGTQAANKYKEHAQTAYHSLNGDPTGKAAVAAAAGPAQQFANDLGLATYASQFATEAPKAAGLQPHATITSAPSAKTTSW